MLQQVATVMVARDGIAAAAQIEDPSYSPGARITRCGHTATRTYYASRRRGALSDTAIRPSVCPIAQLS